MINAIFSRTRLHEHADPAQRILGVEALPDSAPELTQLLTADPDPGVRVAAAKRVINIDTLLAAWSAEQDGGVRRAIAASLGMCLADSNNAERLQLLLSSTEFPDSLRCAVVEHATDAQQRSLAIGNITDEEALITLALNAELADTRVVAAERVRTAQGLTKLTEGARNKDHGVYRIARHRLDAIKDRQGRSAEADAVLAQMEALAHKPGPILTEMVELTRRWQALDMSADIDRQMRCEDARRALQTRLDRDQDEFRAKNRCEQQLKEWLATLGTRAPNEAIETLSAELAAQYDDVKRFGLTGMIESLDEAARQINRWSEERTRLAAAQALVAEAEKLVADTTIDPGTLPERWQALDRSIRTPELTQRFETALIVVEQRRLAHVQHAQQEIAATRARIHALLHSAELALAAGQLREARSAVDQARPLRAAAGTLPKPTIQRLGRLVQQLVELERWQSFGQQNARMQLIERAQALLSAQDPRKIAQEVQQLRNEWKALDQQYAGVPKALWERFDGACEKAYAPAAKYFTELNTQRKAARKQREDFIAQAKAHAPTLLAEPADWRSKERWLREIDQMWHGGELGSLEPKLWKKLDAELKAAVAPVRDALAAARGEAKTVRERLIEEAGALAGKALERDTPSKVKAIQARWQEHAKTIALTPRDERVLWEKFRAACDAVFKARQDKRSEEDARKTSGRKALEDLCGQMEQLARATDKPDQELRRQSRELQDQWRKLAPGKDPGVRNLEARYRKAVAGVDTALAVRVRSRESAVWDTLAAKERLCEALDAIVQSGSDPNDASTRATAIGEQWAALPALAAAWEKKLLARRDAGAKAIVDTHAAADYVKRIDKEVPARGEGLLELELMLGLESPPELQSQRLALQVKQLRDRFKSSVTVSADSAGERLCDWCALPGVLDARDRSRSDKVFAAIKRHRK